jgi:hypothetical protein
LERRGFGHGRDDQALQHHARAQSEGTQTLLLFPQVAC